MKKLLSFLFLTFFALGAINAQKFGHINSQEVLMAMPEREEIAKKIDSYVKELGEIYEEMNVEYNKKVDEFVKNQETWSPAIKKAKEGDLLNLQQRLQQQNDTFREDIAKEQEKHVGPIQEKLRNAINKVGKAEGLIYVFDLSAGSLVYFDATQSKDIADLVKKELNIK